MIRDLEKIKRPGAKVMVVGCVARFRPELKTGQEDDSAPLVAIESLAYNMDKNARRLAVNELYRKPPELTTFLTDRKERVFEDYTGVSQKGSRRGPVGGFVQRAVPRRKPVQDFCGVASGPLPPPRLLHQDRDRLPGQVLILLGPPGPRRGPQQDHGRGPGRVPGGLDQGYQHFTLIGTDIADYGKDIGLDLADLLRNWCLPVPFRLRLRNLNPRWVIDRTADFCEVLRSGKIVFAQIAIQSGNDRILELMKRGYNAGDVMRAVAQVRQACPESCCARRSSSASPPRRRRNSGTR